MLQFPLPLSSLYSLVHGVTGAPGSSRFIRFGPHDHLSFVRKNQVPYPCPPFGWFAYRQCASVTPLYLPRDTKRYTRLYVSVDMWYQRKHLQEVLQFEEIRDDDFNLLVHVKRDGKCVFHRKWYALSAYDIHNLSYTSSG